MNDAEQIAPKPKNKVGRPLKGKFICDICGQDFQKPQLMGAHKRLTHPGHPKRPQKSRAKDSFKCPECGHKFTNPRLLGAHRWHVHKIAGTSASVESKRLKQQYERNLHGNSSRVTNLEEIDGFVLGHTCASIQAIIAHTAERDGIPTELLTSRVVDFLHTQTLRKRGRPRSQV